MAPQIDWGDGQVPRAVAFEDVYYSDQNGLAEADYVFVQPNRLPTRFAGLAENAVFSVAETGFGTGLNFLLTVRLWLQTAPPSAVLYFLSFEKYPLDKTELQKAHAAFDELSLVSQALRDAYPLRLPGWHEVCLFGGRVRLTLWFGDVLQGLVECEDAVDAWFLDGFTPSRNPDMWREALYGHMARLGQAGTTFATFTAAGEVRRGLQKAGFDVSKQPGFGLKREMCFGQLVATRAFSSKTPWFVRPPSLDAPKTAVVIGAGLAGATVAYALAQRGLDVRVLEAASQSAEQASGNLAGAIHPLVTADWNLRSQFYLRGFEIAQAWLKPWIQSGEVTGELNGLMQLAVTDNLKQRLQDSGQRVGLPPDFARWCHAEQASDIVGQETPFEGLYFPQGGWVKPTSVVAQCLRHERIQVRLNEPVTGFEQQHQAWWIHTQEGTLASDVLVVATGALASELNAQLALPIRPVKGQVTHLPPDSIASRLKCPVTHRGYTVSLGAACGEAAAVTGASFEAPSLSPSLSLEADLENAAMVSEALPDWLRHDALPRARAPSGKVGFRPTTADHLPVIGAVPDWDWMQQAYFSQSHTQAVFRYAPQRYPPGLYVSNGHGARGLMSVFLAADMIARQVTGERFLMPMALYHAVHPARFAIRAWRSGKTLG